MITLSTIRGQDRAIAQLRRAIAAERVAHAYLFCGPHGCGKHTTALAFAAALNCQQAPGEGCGQCASCERIAGGIHPDIRTLERKGAAKIIPIATIRTQVIPLLALPPHEAQARFFIVEEANSLQDASANALLKTLEEPPARTHFILGTTAAEKLLPTIRSRCQRVSFAALPADMRAQLADDDEAAQKLGDMVQRMREAITSSDAASLHQAARDIAAERAHIDSALELLSVRLHAEAVQAAMAQRLTQAARLSRQAMSVLATRDAVAHNAHATTALEALVSNLRIET